MPAEFNNRVNAPGNPNTNCTALTRQMPRINFQGRHYFYLLNTGLKLREDIKLLTEHNQVLNKMAQDIQDFLKKLREKERTTLNRMQKEQEEYEKKWQQEKIQYDQLLYPDDDQKIVPSPAPSRLSVEQVLKVLRAIRQLFPQLFSALASRWNSRNNV